MSGARSVNLILWLSEEVSVAPRMLTVCRLAGGARFCCRRCRNICPSHQFSGKKSTADDELATCCRGGWFTWSDLALSRRTLPSCRKWQRRADLRMSRAMRQLHLKGTGRLIGLISSNLEEARARDISDRK